MFYLIEEELKFCKPLFNAYRNVHAGLSADAEGDRCVDDRVEPCFADYRAGVCTKQVRNDKQKK